MLSSWLVIPGLLLLFGAAVIGWTMLQLRKDRERARERALAQDADELRSRLTEAQVRRASGLSPAEHLEQTTRRLRSDLMALAAADPPPRDETPPDVFISYKRDEREQVVAIAQRLEALALKVWFDARLESGTTFDAEINRNVSAARAVLVCWSPGAAASDWVRAEAEIGRQRKVLAAATLRACNLPAPFNLIHSNDLSTGADAANPEWLKTLERIGHLCGRPGIAQFEGAQSRAELEQWISAFPNDPLIDGAKARLQTMPL